MIPKKMFLTKGAGFHKEKLQSFEQALRAAGIAHLNLVKVSSIVPADCKIIDRPAGLKYLTPGEITYCVLARNEVKESNRLLSSSIGVAVPKDPKAYGYLSEHEAFGQTQKEAGDYAEDLAATMLATILGIEFDVDADWDEKREVYRFSDKIVNSRNVTQVAKGKKDIWVTTVAAAVFVDLES